MSWFCSLSCLLFLVGFFHVLGVVVFVLEWVRGRLCRRREREFEVIWFNEEDSEIIKGAKIGV